MDKITLSYGAGGSLTQKLIAEVFAAAFKNEYLDALDDCALLNFQGAAHAFTTDSYVVDPIFFPGGDIGKLAVCGTVNDLSSCAAEPQYLSAGFILEEGLPFATLKKIVASMAGEAKKNNVKIVTGDTKVVPRGKADKIFINTAGVGALRASVGMRRVCPGDKILINGPVGEHGLSIFLSREKFNTRAKIKSDCHGLWGIVRCLIDKSIDIRFMRDPTRGGVAAVANEVARGCGYALQLNEADIPVLPSCRHLSEIFGLEILDIANEGKMIFFVGPRDAARALSLLKRHPLGRGASLIGEVLPEKKERVYLATAVGGEKILGMPMTEPIPRIC